MIDSGMDKKKLYSNNLGYENKNSLQDVIIELFLVMYSLACWVFKLVCILH